MMHSSFNVPSEEYAPFYKGYVDSALGASILDGLARGAQDVIENFQSLSEEGWDYRYDQGKWSPKEMLLHIIDTERVFSYRALLIVRSEKAILPGFDQDEFVLNSYASRRSGSSLIEEFISVRNATQLLFESFSELDLLKIGNANGSNVSVRALGVIIHGHAQHHVAILKKRY